MSLGSKQYVSNGETAKPAGHLWSKHSRNLRESSHPARVPISGASLLLSVFTNARNSSAPPINKETANQFLLNWIIPSNQALGGIEQDSFREFIQYLQPKYPLPKACDTIRNWIIHNYREQSQKFEMTSVMLLPKFISPLKVGLHHIEV